MERNTCATFITDQFEHTYGYMCKHCSTAQFVKDSNVPFWKCNKYNTRLIDNNENNLTRCAECMEKGDE